MDEKRFNTDAVKTKLKEYTEKVKYYRFQCERMDRLQTRIIGVGAQVISDMPKAPSHDNDRAADLIAQKIDLEKELSESVAEILEERRGLEKAIRSLKNADQRTVILSRYIDGDSFRDVNELVFGGKEDFADKEDSYMRRVFNIHGAALIGLAEYYGLYQADTEDTAEA